MRASRLVIGMWILLSSVAREIGESGLHAVDTGLDHARRVGDALRLAIDHGDDSRVRILISANASPFGPTLRVGLEVDDDRIA